MSPEQDTPHVEPLLEVSNLHVDFPSREGIVRAARGVSFSINSGETLGLVGESGSGKTVTAQAILRIIPKPGRVSSGSIVLNQTSESGAARPVNITSLDDRGRTMMTIRRHLVSLVMQEPMSALSPVHTIGKQIIEKLNLDAKRSRRDARKRTIELLDMVGIPNAARHLDAHTFELSGGMRQRAMIAMALASNPSLLIADEPTTAVDVTLQAQILRLLGRLQDELGMAILLITHDLGVVAQIADRVAVMYRGGIVEQGPVADVLGAPRHPYTQGLLESVPDLEDSEATRIATIPGVVPHPFAVVAGCQFHPRCSQVIPEICDQRAPFDTEGSPGHEVCCWLYEPKE